MEFGPPRPSSDEARRARLQQLAYGSDSSPAQRAQAAAALDAIEQEERELIRARAAGTPAGDTVEWELQDAQEHEEEDSSFDRRRALVRMVALLTAIAVGLTAIGAGLSLFF